jgi:hypothetical protein
MQINQKIATLCGLIGELTANIETSEELKKGEKYLLIQQLELALKPMQKIQDEIKKQFSEIATTEPHNFEGAEIFCKIANVKPKLDADKIEADYIRLLSDYDTPYNRSDYLIEQTPRKTIVIQSILGK